MRDPIGGGTIQHPETTQEAALRYDPLLDIARSFDETGSPENLTRDEEGSSFHSGPEGVGMSMLERATGYFNRGWQPLPIALGSKNPGDTLGKGWQKFRITAEELPMYFNVPELNIGVLLGEPSGNLVDIDLDTPFARKVAPAFLPPTGARFGRPGSPGSHYLFRCQDPLYKKYNNPLLASFPNKAGRDRSCLLEFRGKKGLQSIMPGSVHGASGERVEWEEDGEPADVPTEDLKRATGRTAAAALICEFWHEGARNELTMALSGGLLRNGWQEDEVVSFVEAICSATGDEETEGRLATVTSTNEKLVGGEHVTGFPKLAELTDPKVVSAVCKWLEIDKWASKAKHSVADVADVPPFSGDAAALLDAAKPFKKKKQSQASELVNLADDMDLFHTPEGDYFASFNVKGHIETHRTNTKAFREHLARQFFENAGRIPSSQAMQDALGVFNGKARYEGCERPVFLRLASYNGNIYLDLCNESWEVVEIRKDGHSVLPSEDCPVRFRRTKHMGSLPTPGATGSIDDLKPFLNFDDDDGDVAYPLLLGWLVNCFRPDYPFPILIITGEPGTAKSTTAKFFRELVDPSVMPHRACPRNEKDLMIAADNSWVCSFDNVSAVPDWLSDALCRLSTGGGIGSRTLYENDEETILKAKRPIILNGIGNFASRSDLVDRAQILTLRVIPKHERLSERELQSRFKAKRQSIFTGLILAVSTALRNLDDTQLGELPRMADYAQWASAAEPALGLAPGGFMRAFSSSLAQVHSIVLEGSLAGDAVVEYCHERGEFSEDMLLKDLLATLRSRNDQGAQHKDFPKTSKKLRNDLQRINPNLRELGINIRFLGRNGPSPSRGASIRITNTCLQTSLSSQPSESRQKVGQAPDATGDVTSDGKSGNVTEHPNVTSNVIKGKSRNRNGYGTITDDSDDSDVTLPISSNLHPGSECPECPDGNMTQFSAGLLGCEMCGFRRSVESKAVSALT